MPLPQSEPDVDDVPARKPIIRPGFFSWIVFWFVDPLIRLGHRQRLEPEDVYSFDGLQTKPLHDCFNAAWEKELTRNKEPNDWAIRRAVVAGTARGLIITGLLYVIATGTTLAGPLLLKEIVKGLECYHAQHRGIPLTCPERSQLYYYCIGLFLAPVIQSLAENQQNFLLQKVGTQMRNSLMAAIYRKCLRLSNSALQSESTGKVVTLMSNDAQKLQDVTMAIHALWGSPIYVIVIIGLLYQEVGWATFVGVAVMALLAPLSGKVAGKLAMLRRSIMKWTDKRVGLMNEVVNGIQMIKYYAWERSFMAEVMKARDGEAQILRRTAVWQGFFGMILFSGPVLVAIACFGSYTLAGDQLTTAKAYAALALFSLLRFPMSFLPMLITMMVNALVALKRIQAFLLKAEAQDDEESSKLGAQDHEESKETAADRGVVRVSNGSFTWDESLEKPTLTNITFEALPGTLTMIVGSVGSGKSSMLGTVIKNISKVSGTVQVAGQLAYVAQQAWIINDTVQENILLGSALDPERYHEAVELAQLVPDLEMLPNGDLTEIGDRGITLSGGQKQRVSIARALYSDADIIVLDDPLSAVDSHVGRALFEKCIRTYLKSKTVILVTNALHYLPYATNVIWMEAGTIRDQGTYQELMARGLNIADIVHMDDDEGEDQEEQRSKGAAPLLPSGTKRSQSISMVRHRNMFNLTGVEAREQGSISGKVIGTYLNAAGGWKLLGALVLLYTLEQGSRVYTDMWVGIWFSDEFNRGSWFYLGIYTLLGLTYGLVTYIRSLVFLFGCVRAALNLHNQLLRHMMRLPKSFFDTNPAGRILNRFSRDTEIMDATLSASLIQFIGCVATYLSILVVISLATRWFAIAILPISIIYFFIQRYYIPTARELQRIESISRSPIYSRFSETLLGVATIRAYRKAKYFLDISDQSMQDNANAYMTQKAASAWLAMRLDFIGLLITTLTGVLCIQGGIEPGLAGLALVYALDLTRYLKHGTAMASKAEADFNSAERIIQYLEPPTEADDDTPPSTMAQLGKDWPGEGSICAEKVTMRYRPETPLVLKGVSFDIKGGEKVGLVGRTGSGKSSLFLVLFRMVEPEAGRILIDGVDTKTIGLHLLRSKLSIIPQDPFMFSGTVRHNLDPFQQYQDQELWKVLEDVGLKEVIAGFETKLETAVVDNGANFSQGQKQLFCMARAMLRRSRILMMDEATASVDPQSDALIQGAIRSVFSQCTLLTIAHRLNTIMDSDRVIVMQDGVVVENDEPDHLLQLHEGIFTSMVEQTGKASSHYLKDVARSASQIRSRNNSVNDLRAIGDGSGLVSTSSSPSPPSSVRSEPHDVTPGMIVISSPGVEGSQAPPSVEVTGLCQGGQSTSSRNSSEVEEGAPTGRHQ